MSWLQPNPFEQQLFLDTAKRWPEIMDLARVLCLTTRIEPLLLRNARRRFVPQAGPEIESLLWFSPLVVARSSRHIIFHHGAARQLADQLRKSPEIGQVWDYTRLATRHWSPEERLERDLRYCALSGDQDGIRKGLRDILRRIKAEPNEAERIALARWVKRSLPVINNPGIQSEESLLLAQYASLALSDSGSWSQLGPPSVLPDWLAANLPAPLEQAQLGVNLHADVSRQVLVFKAPGQSTQQLTFPTPLPADIYVVPEGREGQWYTVGTDSRIEVPNRSPRLMLVTRDGRQYSLRSDFERVEGLRDAEERPSVTIYLCYVEADRGQAEQIQEWLETKKFDVELVQESGRPNLSKDGPKLWMIRLWTRNALKFWEGRKFPEEIELENSFILRTDPSEPPVSGAGGFSRVFDWSDWVRLEESSEAGQFLNQINKWLEQEKLYDEALGADSPAADEIDRLLKQINDPATEPPRRLEIGDRLAELGDPR
ncbi:MAG: hypothetical protein L0Y43_07650, partial [Methylococcaceae bacterium]|nr:hypothetical protein [Methylococcaceae bacterium]